VHEVRERELVLRDASSDECDRGDAYEERTKSGVERTKRTAKRREGWRRIEG